MTELQDAIVVIGVPGPPGGGVTSGDLSTAISGLAPGNATYITQTTNGTLSAEQALGSLATGILKNTTSTGVLSIATGSDLPAHNHTGVAVSKGFVIDGGGSTITTGVKFDIVFESAMTITGWTALADQGGAISVGCWVDTYANYPPTAGDLLLTVAITATNSKAQATGLSHSVSAGDIMRINVGSVTDHQRVSIALTGTRTV